MAGEVLVRVDGVSKKFCRSLKRSLWYGLQDAATELTGRTANQALRQDEFWAVKDVSFELRRGECLGLIGRNGAGKTTLLRMLNGLIKPDRGRIEIYGRINALIALGAGFNPVLTGRENIQVSAALLGLNRRDVKQKLDEIIDFTEMDDFIDSPVQTYSSGMQVRLGFAVASALDPDVLLLDEVLAVGDAAFRIKCFNRINRLLQNSAVVFVSHDTGQVSRICTRLLWLHQGVIRETSHHISATLIKYQTSFSRAPKTFSQHTEKAEIYNVKILDHNKKESERLIRNQPFSIAINACILESLAQDTFSVLLTISSDGQRNIAQVHENFRMVELLKPFKISLNFKGAPFTSGTYFLTTSIIEGCRGGLVSVVYNSAYFTIEHSVLNYAPVSLKPEKNEIWTEQNTQDILKWKSER